MTVKTLTGFGENITGNANIYAKDTLMTLQTKAHNLCFDEVFLRFSRSKEAGHRL
jgi:ABC-type polysaccharide/polyol phosphate transport system ATPase subunit